MCISNFPINRRSLAEQRTNRYIPPACFFYGVSICNKLLQHFYCFLKRSVLKNVNGTKFNKTAMKSIL